MRELALIGNKSIKGDILEILMNIPAPTVTKIKNILLKNYNQTVSYQAVHKAVQEMYREGMLLKLGKEYIISDGYIRQLEKFVDQLKKSKKSVFNMFEKKEIEKITFGKPRDIYEFLIQALSLDYFSDRYEETYVWVSHFWPLTISVKPKKDVIHNMFTNRKTFILVNNATLLDRLCLYYAKRKFSPRTKLGCAKSNGFELLIIDDTVVQIFFPESIRKRIDSIFSSIKKVANLDVVEQMADLGYAREPINVVIIRNKEIADNYKNGIQRLM